MFGCYSETNENVTKNQAHSAIQVKFVNLWAQKKVILLVLYALTTVDDYTSARYWTTSLKSSADR